MLSSLVITFLPRSKHLLISCLQSPSAVILEPLKNKVSHGFPVSPSICHEVMGPDAMILVFWMLSFKSTFSLSSFTFKQTVMLNKTISPAQISLSSRPVFPTTCQISGEGTGDPLQCSCLETSMDGGAWWAAVHGIAESDTTEWLHFHFSLSLFTFIHWRRKWQATPVFLPGESQGWWSLVGCRLWGRTESDTTETT